VAKNGTLKPLYAGMKDPSRDWDCGREVFGSAVEIIDLAL
jgi:hypothetical protein